jgi:hypothetical protein
VRVVALVQGSVFIELGEQKTASTNFFTSSQSTFPHVRRHPHETVAEIRTVLAPVMTWQAMTLR